MFNEKKIKITIIICNGRIRRAALDFPWYARTRSRHHHRRGSNTVRTGYVWPAARIIMSARRKRDRGGGGIVVGETVFLCVSIVPRAEQPSIPRSRRRRRRVDRDEVSDGRAPEGRERRRWRVGTREEPRKLMDQLSSAKLLLSPHPRSD